MIPEIVDHFQSPAPPTGAEAHILVVASDNAARYSLANLLLDSGMLVTTAATFGVVEVLLEGNDVYDLMITAQSAEEITQFGVPQLARSIDPDLPILVLEFGTAAAPAVVELVNQALSRWPLRDRLSPAIH